MNRPFALFRRTLSECVTSSEQNQVQGSLHMKMHFLFAEIRAASGSRELGQDLQANLQARRLLLHLRRHHDGGGRAGRARDDPQGGGRPQGQGRQELHRDHEGTGLGHGGVRACHSECEHNENTAFCTVLSFKLISTTFDSDEQIRTCVQCWLDEMRLCWQPCSTRALSAVLRRSSGTWKFAD